jgi:protein involved in polysaccharide export with SLBB domain
MIGLALVALLSGCDEVNTLFRDSWLDPTQIVYNDLKTVKAGLRPQASIYDQLYGGVLPQGATEPQTQDLQVVREDYRIVPGDRLRISVYELLTSGREEQYDRQVSDTGYVDLPPARLPVLFIADMTELQAKEVISKAYIEAGVLKEPQVSVSAVVRMGRRITLLGPFGTQGAFDLPAADFRLLQVLGMVANVTNASTEWLYVIRTDQREPLRPRPAEGAAGTTNSPAGQAVPPSALPGGEPLPLPGSGPLPLPGGTMPPTPTPTTSAPVSVTPYSGPVIPKSLESFRPLGLPTTKDNEATAAKVTPQPANATRPAGAAATSQGNWMLVGGKWTYVNQPTAPAGGEGGAAAQAAATTEKKTRIIRIPLAPLRAGENRYNIVMRPDDVVVAPQPIVGEFYVMGNVARPGVYSLSDRQITLSQAIVAAGGWGSLADPSKVQLVRRITSDQVEMYTIDVGQILLGHRDDYILKPYDTINVGTNTYAPFLAVIRNAFRLTYGLGFVYDRNFADIDSFGSRNNPHNTPGG